MMAVVVVMMMGAGGDESNKNQKNPFFFRDFLGVSMSCAGETPPPDPRSKGGDIADAASASASASVSVGLSSGGHHGFISPSSDLGSERQGVKSSEDFHFHGRKSVVTGPEMNNTLSGRKRNCSESVYSGLIDRVPPVRSDSLESSCMIKMFGKEVVNERLQKSRDDEIMLSMQRPPRPTSLILHPPLSVRPDSPISKEEQSLSKIPGQLIHHNSRVSQAGTYFDLVSSSYAYKDANAVATIISQSATDEGSRTGIKGSGVMSIDNPIKMACERNSTGFLTRPKSSQANKPEPSNIIRRSTTASAGHQMTIFYAGQAHVFDNVHPNKADVIMALAGLNGGSWSTTYSCKPSEQTIMNDAKVLTREQMQMGNLPLSVHRDKGHALSQIAGIPLASDLSGVRSGGHQSGMVIRDARVMAQAAEPSTDDKRDA